MMGSGNIMESPLPPSLPLPLPPPPIPFHHPPPPFSWPRPSPPFPYFLLLFPVLFSPLLSPPSHPIPILCSFSSSLPSPLLSPSHLPSLSPPPSRHPLPPPLPSHHLLPPPPLLSSPAKTNLGKTKKGEVQGEGRGRGVRRPNKLRVMRGFAYYTPQSPSFAACLAF